MQTRTGQPHIATETLNDSSLFWGHGIDAGVDTSDNKHRHQEQPPGASQTKLATKLFSNLFQDLLEISDAARASSGWSFPVHWAH